MRVLHVYRTYYPDSPGGIQEAIRQICQATAERGVENTVFTFSPRPWPEVINRPEATVVRTRSWLCPWSCDLGGAAAFTLFKRLAKAADLIHYQHPWPFADLLHAWGGGDTPALLTYQSDVVRQRLLDRFYSPLRRWMLGKMQTIVTTSPVYAAGSPILADPSLATRLRLIPLGISEESREKPSAGQLRRSLGLADKPYFLFLGALRYYKGLEYLLQASVQVKAPVVVAGGGADQVAWRQRAEALGARRVIFTGPVSEADKQDLLNHCRALVLPSHLRSEAFGLVLVEAAMAGRPMISCEIGTGTSWINRHRETGQVVPPADPTSLAEAMRMLLYNDDRAAALGLGARRRYEKYFSGPALGQAYHELYQEILARIENQRKTK